MFYRQSVFLLLLIAPTWQIMTDSREQRFSSRFSNCIDSAKRSAVTLINLLVENFTCFRDIFLFPPAVVSTPAMLSSLQQQHGESVIDIDDNGEERRQVHFLKRAQILVADLWACFQETSYGAFDDINRITMFAGTSFLTRKVDRRCAVDNMGSPKVMAN